MHQKQTKRKGGLSAETTLWEQAQAGCQQSLNQLMSQHDRLVHAVVRKQVLGDLPYEMALHAGRVGLWKAIRGYDPHRGTAFSSYAWLAIMRSVWMAVKDYHQETAQSQLSMSLTDQGQEPDWQWERRALHTYLRAAVATLPLRLQRILHFRYGWDGHQPATFTQIGAQLGITKQRAHQLHRDALMRLRQPAISYKLRSLLDKQSPTDYLILAAETAVWLQLRARRR